MPCRTFDDKIDGLVITFIDITERKHIELELLEIIEEAKEHQILYNELFEHMPVAFNYNEIIFLKWQSR